VFDVVFCVNALHHFPEPRRFVREARRVLGHGGVLAVIGMDPHDGRDRWYIYDYFPGTSETDRERFPSRETLFEWLRAAGFGGMEWRVVEHIVRPRVGREVLEDPILQKNGTSQLALLTDEAYAAGRRRIEADLGTAEARGETMVFLVDLRLVMISGHAAG